MPLGNRVGTAVGRQSLNFANGSTATVTIERGQLLYGLQLNLGGTLTTTQASAAGDRNTPSRTRVGDFEACIKNIAVRANGNDVLFSMTGNDLWNFNRYFWGRNPRISPELGNSTTNTAGMASSLFIPFVRSRAFNPEDNLLDTRRLSALNLDITWGTGLDINSTTGSALSSVAANVTPVGFSRLAGSLPAEETIYSPCRRFIVTAACPAAGEFTVNLPPGPIYTEFLLNGVRPAVAADSSIAATAGEDIEDQLVTNLSLESGTTRFVEWGWANLNDFGHNYVGAESNTNLRRSAASALFGWAYLPNAFGGRVSEGIDSGELGELKFKFTAAKAGTIRIICTAVSPVARVGSNVALTVTPART